MAETQETHADIIAEMREIHVAEFQDYADRLEAAALREIVTALAAVILPPQGKAGENGWLAWVRAMQAKARAALATPATAEKSSAVGDAAKLREALREAIGETCLRCTKDCGDCLNLKAGWMAKAKTALSAPARNCDAMDWRTAWKTWCEKFHPETPVGYSAEVKGTEAFMDWFTAPATAEEGGTK